MDCIKVAKYSGTVQGRSRMNFDAALEKGLVHFAGMEKTKTGSGDKDEAYVVRKNCFFRTFFYLVLFATICAVYIFSTKLRIEIIERDVVDEEIKHRKSEHSVQLKLVSVMLEQKQVMEEEMAFVNEIEEFRATLLKELGTYGNLLETRLAAMKADANVRMLTAKFTETSIGLEESLEAIVGPAQQKAELSKKRLTDLHQSIIQEVEEDEEELRFYLKKLAQYGISERRAAKFESEKYDGLNGAADKEESSHISEIEQESAASERNMQHFLDQFFQKVRTNKFPKMRRIALLKLEKFEQGTLEMLEYEDELELKEVVDLLKELQDNRKEVDMQATIKRFDGMLFRYAPNVEAFNGKNGATGVEYIKKRVEEARIALNRERLLELYEDWKVRKKYSTFQVLSKLESLLALEFETASENVS